MFQLFQTFINRLLYIRANIHFTQFRIPHIGTQAVTEEDVHRPVFWIHPGASPRETGMPINGSGSRGSTRTILQILQIRFVEAQSPAADSGSFRSEPVFFERHHQYLYRLPVHLYLSVNGYLTEYGGCGHPFHAGLSGLRLPEVYEQVFLHRILHSVQFVVAV